MADKDNMFLGAYAGGRISLEQVPNGGWVVHSVPEERGLMSSVIGSFTTTADLLAALSHSLPHTVISRRDA